MKKAREIVLTGFGIIGSLLVGAGIGYLMNLIY